VLKRGKDFITTVQAASPAQARRIAEQQYHGNAVIVDAYAEELEDVKG